MGFQNWFACGDLGNVAPGGVDDDAVDVDRDVDEYRGDGDVDDDQNSILDAAHNVLVSSDDDLVDLVVDDPQGGGAAAGEENRTGTDLVGAWDGRVPSVASIAAAGDVSTRAAAAVAEAAGVAGVVLMQTVCVSRCTDSSQTLAWTAHRRCPRNFLQNPP